MERLLVDRVDRHLRRAEHARIIERPDFQDHGRQSWPPRNEMRAAFGAEFARDRLVEVAALELLRRALGVAKAIARHEQEHIWRAAADVLALAAVALRLQGRLALG